MCVCGQEFTIEIVEITAAAAATTVTKVKWD